MTHVESGTGNSLKFVEDRKWRSENTAPPAFEAAVLSMLALTCDTMLALLAP
jgi:hypothetical protein